MESVVRVFELYVMGEDISDVGLCGLSGGGHDLIGNLGQEMEVTLAVVLDSLHQALCIVLAVRDELCGIQAIRGKERREESTLWRTDARSSRLISSVRVSLLEISCCERERDEFKSNR
jgi:hypothetical protein